MVGVCEDEYLQDDLDLEAWEQESRTRTMDEYGITPVSAVFAEKSDHLHDEPEDDIPC